MIAAIIATGEAGYTRHPAPGQTTHTFLRDAVVDALKDANLKLSDVDGLAVSSFSIEPDKAIDIAWRFGMSLALAAARYQRRCIGHQHAGPRHSGCGSRRCVRYRCRIRRCHRSRGRSENFIELQPRYP